MSDNYWAIGDEQILDESLRQYVEVMNGARQLGAGLRQQWIGAVATYAGIRRSYLEVKRENKAAEVADAQEQARMRQAEERAQEHAENQAYGLYRHTQARDWWENAEIHEIDQIDSVLEQVSAKSSNPQLKQAHADFAKKADPRRQSKLRGMVKRAKKADFWKNITKREGGKEEIGRLFFYMEKYKAAGIYKIEDVQQVEEMAKLSLGEDVFKEAQLDEKFDEITQELREAIPEVAEVDNKTLKETMSEGELCLAEDKEYAWSSDEEIETVKNAPFLSEERRNKIIDGLKAKNEKFKEWAQENPQRARAWCKRNNVQEPEWLKDENAKDSEAKEKGAEVSQGKENESVSERQKDDEPAQNMKEDKPRTKGSPRDDVDPAMKKKASNDAEVAAVMGVVGAAGLGAASESLNTTQPGARKMGDSNKPLRVPTMGDKTKSAGRSL